MMVQVLSSRRETQMESRYNISLSLILSQVDKIQSTDIQNFCLTKKKKKPERKGAGLGEIA